jgi:hypothetical protein
VCFEGDGVCFTTHRLWDSAIVRFRSIVFIGMHPVFWLPFWDRNSGYQSTCGVSKGLIRATVLSSPLERASMSNSEELSLKVSATFCHRHLKQIAIA